MDNDSNMASYKGGDHNTNSGDGMEGIEDSTSEYNPTNDAQHLGDDEMDFGDLQGYEDLGPNAISNTDSPFNTPGAAKTRPAFFDRTTKRAERAALRTQVNESESFLLIEDANVLPSPSNTPSRIPGTFGRANRNPGDCLPAYSKKITAQLDSDDELMMTMREKGFTDGQIAERLAKDGRVRYDRKTISTRIGRIKVAQAAHVDLMLEEGYKEWQHEEDLRLMQAFEMADIEVNHEIERIKSWRFKKVAEYMRRLDKDSVFSEKACRDRYNALNNGTAKVPIDEDDDPEARRAEMELFREARERQRDSENAEKEKKAALDKKIKEEAKMRQAQKAERTARAREKKQEGRAQRAMQRAAQNQMKLHRAQENKAQKMQRLESIRAQKAAEKEAEDRKRREQNKNESLKLNALADLKTVTADTPDPRSYLSMEDLRKLCEERALSAEAKSKEELLQRLRDADDVRGLTQLKIMCRAKGLNSAGTKVQAKYQLALAEARKFASFEVGLKAAEAPQPAKNAPIDLMEAADDEDEDME